jgi:maltose O-acetyltransferase
VLNLGLREPFFLWVANSLPSNLAIDAQWRARLLALAGVQLEKNLRIFAPVEIKPSGAACRIWIGNGTFINSGVRFCAEPPATITIGKRVEIGPRCSFETRTHSVNLIDGKRTGENRSIVVEDNVWIAANAVILPGVVNRDVEPYTVVGGVPARKIKDVENLSTTAPHPPAAILESGEPTPPDR